jgi:hypothetical protein
VKENSKKGNDGKKGEKICNRVKKEKSAFRHFAGKGNIIFRGGKRVSVNCKKAENKIFF